MFEQKLKMGRTESGDAGRRVCNNVDARQSWRRWKRSALGRVSHKPRGHTPFARSLLRRARGLRGEKGAGGGVECVSCGNCRRRGQGLRTPRSHTTFSARSSDLCPPPCIAVGKRRAPRPFGPPPSPASAAAAVSLDLRNLSEKFRHTCILEVNTGKWPRLPSVKVDVHLITLPTPALPLTWHTTCFTYCLSPPPSPSSRPRSLSSPFLSPPPLLLSPPLLAPPLPPLLSFISVNICIAVRGFAP